MFPAAASVRLPRCQRIPGRYVWVHKYGDLVLHGLRLILERTGPGLCRAPVGTVGRSIDGSCFCLRQKMIFRRRIACCLLPVADRRSASTGRGGPWFLSMRMFVLIVITIHRWRPFRRNGCEGPFISNGYIEAAGFPLYWIPVKPFCLPESWKKATLSKVPVRVPPIRTEPAGMNLGSLCNDIIGHITCYTGSINEGGAPHSLHPPGVKYGPWARAAGQVPLQRHFSQLRIDPMITFSICHWKIAVESTVGAGPLFREIHMFIRMRGVYVRHGADITCVEVKGGTCRCKVWRPHRFNMAIGIRDGQLWSNTMILPDSRCLEGGAQVVLIKSRLLSCGHHHARLLFAGPVHSEWWSHLYGCLWPVSAAHILQSNSHRPHNTVFCKLPADTASRYLSSKPGAPWRTKDFDVGIDGKDLLQNRDQVCGVLR